MCLWCGLCLGLCLCRLFASDMACMHLVSHDGCPLWHASCIRVVVFIAKGRPQRTSPTTHISRVRITLQLVRVTDAKMHTLHQVGVHHAPV